MAHAFTAQAKRQRWYNPTNEADGGVMFSDTKKGNSRQPQADGGVMFSDTKKGNSCQP
jgi:hypothetical protein